MRVLSLFSGVGGFDMGLEATGMTTVFQCEIDKHARAVLDHHWPDVPKWDDVSTLTGRYILDHCDGVDVVAWGSPCQDLSLAGKRAGLSGERSGLFHQGIRIIKELRELSNGKYPTWSVWENVVGALSSNGGADFGEVLYEMDEAGACFSEWVVLDAQYFGVPQRRRRVFVVSCFDSATADRCGDKIFAVEQSGGGDSAKGKPTRKGSSGEVAESSGTGGELGSGNPVANTISASLYHHGTVVNQDANNGHLVVESVETNTELDSRVVLNIVGPLTTGMSSPRGSETSDSGHLVIESVETYAKSRRAQSSTDAEPVLSFDTQFGSNANVFEDQSPTLKASQQPPSVAHKTSGIIGSDIVGSLNASDYKFPQQQQVMENKIVIQDVVHETPTRTE